MRFGISIRNLLTVTMLCVGASFVDGCQPRASDVSRNLAVRASAVEMPQVIWRLRRPANWFGDVFVEKAASSYVFRGITAYTNGMLLTVYPNMEITQLWYRIDYTHANSSYVNSVNGYDWFGDVVYYGREHNVLAAADRATHPLWWVDEPNSLPYKTNALHTSILNGTNLYTIVDIQFSHSTLLDNTRKPTYGFGDLPCAFVPDTSQVFNSFPFTIRCVLSEANPDSSVEFATGFDGMVQINVVEHHVGSNSVPDYLDVTFDKLFEGEIPFLEKTTP